MTEGNGSAGSAQRIDVSLPVEDYLDLVGQEEPAPGGGSVAALTIALAAALVEKSARFSRDHWDQWEGMLVQARILRARAIRLHQEDAEAYEEVLTALRLPKELEQEVRDATIGGALERAAAVPLLIADVATDIAELAAIIAEEGNPNLRPDACAGAVLAAAAARACANLVEVNLAITVGDERVEQGNAFVEKAERAAKRTLGALT